MLIKQYFVGQFKTVSFCNSLLGSNGQREGSVRLEVLASLVEMEGVPINGMAFTLCGSHAWWDRAGVRHNSWRGTKYYRFNGQTVTMRKNGVLTYLHGDRDPIGSGSTIATSNSIGKFIVTLPVGAERQQIPPRSQRRARG